jgi:hypothetical protein
MSYPGCHASPLLSQWYERRTVHECPLWSSARAGEARAFPEIDFTQAAVLKAILGISTGDTYLKHHMLSLRRAAPESFLLQS